MSDIVVGDLDRTRAIDVQVKSGLPGPPGPPGPEGPEGPAGPAGPPGTDGRATTIVLVFGFIRTPDDLPDDFIIDADWDGTGRPPVDLVVATGEALVYQRRSDPLDQHVFARAGDEWVDLGAISGPPGPEGPRGSQGEIGPIGPQGGAGPAGPQGAPGPAGGQGPVGPPGPSGPQGAVGPAGPQGVRGPIGERGETGDKGDAGEQGLRGEPGPPSFPDAPPGGPYGRLDGGWTQVLPLTGGTVSGGLTVLGPALLMTARAMGTFVLDLDPTEDDHAATKRYIDVLIAAIPEPPDLSPYARLDGAQMTGELLLADDPTNDLGAATKRYAESLMPDIPPPPDLSPFARLAGAQFTGPLITQTGNSNTNLGLSIGENSTGFWRTGTYLIAVISGQTAWQTSSVEMMLGVRLNMATQLITNVGNPTAAGDALNRGFADARYLQVATGGAVTGPITLWNTTPTVDQDVVTKGYVDQRRAQSLMVTLPGDVTTDLASWINIAPVGPYSIPRGGNSRIMVSVIFDCTYSGNDGQIVLAGVRLNQFPTVVRRAFLYKSGGQCPGLCVQFFLDVTGTSLGQFDVQVSNLLWAGGTSPNITVLAGSQILVTDEGPR